MNDAPRGNILIVDDDPKVLQVTGLLLREKGFSTCSASSVREAMESLEQTEIDTVLTDIVMPEETGMDLLEKAHGYDPDLPVILFSGYGDLDNAMEAVKKGAFDFILKPYKTAGLVGSIERAVRYRRLARMDTQYRHVLEELNMGIEALMTERAMNVMALTVADRVRNPATVIGLTSGRLLKDEGLSDKTKAGLAVIAAEAGKLEGIVRDFQSFLEQKESRFTYEDVNNVVESVILIIDKEASRARVELALDISKRTLQMNMEKSLLKIALLQVMRNALEATPEGGRITLKTSGDWDNVTFSISDTGHGIPPGDLESIFDPFFTTREHRFGMGLPLIRQIVREHNGEVGVESTTGIGTTVTMSFPTRWKEHDVPI